MMSSDEPTVIEQLLETSDLALALGSDRFKQFLDHVPIAIAVAALEPAEHVVYVNAEFERLSGQTSDKFLGEGWDQLTGAATALGDDRRMGEVVTLGGDYIGSYVVQRDGAPVTVDAWSNIIEDDDSRPVFRLLALLETAVSAPSMLDTLQEQVREKDTQLRELQHRVKNNLQMITALIRVEARGIVDRSTGEGFDRLAGRVEALGLLYQSLGAAGLDDGVDLGTYLSQIAGAVMRAHAVNGVHLSLQVDAWPVSLNVAMPTGLVVNELLTNALKHAFSGRDGGTISLSCTTDGTVGSVIVSDDGVGLPEGVGWPKPGKLSAMIVQSLLQNAKARLDVRSTPQEGLCVTILFDPEDADSPSSQ